VLAAGLLKIAAGPVVTFCLTPAKIQQMMKIAKNVDTFIDRLAPESMGLKVDYGNNIHINLEPETREETKRLYEALSDGGKVTMELQDMFWGAYYGSCTDKYGVNWMFNCAEKGE